MILVSPQLLRPHPKKKFTITRSNSTNCKLMMMQVDEIKLVVPILHSYRELSHVIVICCVVDMGLWGITTPLPYAANGDMTK
jgi:hypothetical protein